MNVKSALPRIDANRTAFGWGFAIEQRHGVRQYFAAWYLRGIDCGVFILGKEWRWCLS